jgi:hypothetical protein
MKLFPEARLIMLAGGLLVSLGATSATSKLLYQDTLTTPNGTQQNVTAMVTVAPESNGTRVTVAATGQAPVTVTISSGGTLPAPQGTPSPQRAQGALILQRIMLLGQIRRALPIASTIDVRIPVLAPGASEQLMLPARLAQSAAVGKQMLTGSASASTTATIDPEKAKIHGILPARRMAERAKNTLTPSHVTLPDQITASVRASLTGAAVTKLSGHVAHALSAHGQTTTLNETWSLEPAP